MISRRHILSASSLLLAPTLNGPARADTFPTKPVILVVPASPGGAVDNLARALADKLTQRWNQSVIVDNRAGGTEVIGTTFVARARPDGYTLLLGTDSGLEMNQFLFKKLPYNPAIDLTPITRIVEGSLMIVVRSDSPFKSVQDLVKAAKDKPGTISYGSFGAGSSVHLALNWFAHVAGDAPFTHVPYKGVGPAVTDVLAGVINFTGAPLSVVAGHVKEGKMRILAHTGPARIAAAPDVPTLAELGYKDAVAIFGFSLTGPGKLPPALASQIASDVAAVASDPEFRARNIDAFAFTFALEKPENFARYLELNKEKQRQRVAAANVQLD